MSLRLYSFPSKNLRIEEYGFYTAHAIVALLRAHNNHQRTGLFKFNSVERWADEFKSIIITQGKTDEQLEHLKNLFINAETQSNVTIPWLAYYDKRLDDALTCIVAIIPAKIYEVVTVHLESSNIPIYTSVDWDYRYLTKHPLYELVHTIQLSPRIL